jgi:hypothetical protein
MDKKSSGGLRTTSAAASMSLMAVVVCEAIKRSDVMMISIVCVTVLFSALQSIQ